MKTMHTVELLALMQAEYPDREWCLEIEKGRENAPVLFTVDGTAIFDPFESPCGREPRADRYGLSDEHARLLRRHNRAYAALRLGFEADLAFVFDKVKAAVTANPTANAELFLDDYGFTVFGTGGGCMAYGLFAKDERHLLVTDRTGSTLPITMGDALVRMYRLPAEQGEP